MARCVRSSQSQPLAFAELRARIQKAQKEQKDQKKSHRHSKRFWTSWRPPLSPSCLTLLYAEAHTKREGGRAQYTGVLGACKRLAPTCYCYRPGCPQFTESHYTPPLCYSKPHTRSPRRVLEPSSLTVSDVTCSRKAEPKLSAYRLGSCLLWWFALSAAPAPSFRIRAQANVYCLFRVPNFLTSSEYQNRAYRNPVHSWLPGVAGSHTTGQCDQLTSAWIRDMRGNSPQLHGVNAEALIFPKPRH